MFFNSFGYHNNIIKSLSSEDREPMKADIDTGDYVIILKS